MCFNELYYTFFSDGGIRGSGKWSRQGGGGMMGLVESLRESRPKSPHMNNEEPIELAHFPDAHPPRPNEKPKIERDDFPAPPYPFTDPGNFYVQHIYYVVFCCFQYGIIHMLQVIFYFIFIESATLV